jgi:arsenical pump membrane protein
LFAAAADRISGLRVGTLPLFFLAMALVGTVTVVLTLDSAVLFLTPILVALAHRRGIDDEPFLYGCVFMANAASLLLPGANLTNLLVIAHEPITGGAFATRMFPAWAAAVVATTVVVMAAHRRSLSAASVATTERTPVTSPVSALAIAAAAGLVLTMREPALPVLGVGLLVAGSYLGTGRLARPRVTQALNVPLLAGLFAATVALGTLARVWKGPSDLVGRADRPVTLILSVVAAAALNNLPAATLLSARAPAHPRMLLLGLNVGPNLVVSGSLAGILWLRLARASGGRPSVRRFSAIGIVLVPVTLAAAFLALAASPAGL